MISSIKDPRIKFARNLHSSQGRRDHQACLLEGIEAIQWFLDGNYGSLQHIFYSKKASKEANDFIHKRTDTIFHEVKSGVFQKIISSSNQVDLVGVVSFAELEQKKHSKQKILILDEVCDPGNIGTLVRVAFGFGIHMIVFISKDKDLFSRKTIIASRGKVFHLPSRIFSSSQDAYSWLKETHCYLLGTQAGASSTIEDFKGEVEQLNKPLGIILGNESTGISEFLLKKADRVVRIPLSRCLDSLNVGVAGGIILYELFHE